MTAWAIVGLIVLVLVVSTGVGILIGGYLNANGKRYPRP